MLRLRSFFFSFFLFLFRPSCAGVFGCRWRRWHFSCLFKCRRRLGVKGRRFNVLFEPSPSGRIIVPEGYALFFMTIKVHRSWLRRFVGKCLLTLVEWCFN